MSDTTNSTSSSTGSITSLGGIGVAKNLHTNANVSLDNATSVLSNVNTTASTSSSTGAIQCAGGAYFGSDTIINTTLKVPQITNGSCVLTVPNSSVSSGTIVTTSGSPSFASTCTFTAPASSSSTGGAIYIDPGSGVIAGSPSYAYSTVFKDPQNIINSGTITEASTVRILGGPGILSGGGVITNSYSLDAGGHVYFRSDLAVASIKSAPSSNLITVPSPGSTDTFALLDNTQTFSGLKTFSSSVNLAGGATFGVGATAPTISWGTAYSNFPSKNIALFDGFANNYQFYGFGISSAQLNYTVDASTSDHVFYCGLTSSSRTELFRIKGTSAVQMPSTGTLALSNTTASTSSSTGAIQCQGGAYFGAASIHAGSIAINAGLTASGSSSNDFSGGSGTFKTSTGAVTIGSGAISVTGTATFSGATNAILASGSGAVDFSGNSGIFKTSTGAVTIGSGAITLSGATATTNGFRFGSTSKGTLYHEVQYGTYSYTTNIAGGSGASQSVSFTNTFSSTPTNILLTIISSNAYNEWVIAAADTLATGSFNLKLTNVNPTGANTAIQPIIVSYQAWY